MKNLVFFILFILTSSCVGESERSSKADLLGPDKNNNQVRDDVDEYILKNFKGLNNIKAAY